MGLSKLLRVLKNRIHKFDATLLGIREITHDTKVFTFSLPKGWNKKFLEIGEHITLQYCICYLVPRSTVRCATGSTRQSLGLTQSAINFSC
jgi:hypothetical protein